VDTVVTSQDIVVGFYKAGIDIDNIVFIQRKASNNTWIVSFNSKVAKDAALNEPTVSYAKAAEKGKEADVAKQAEEEKKRADEKAHAERARRKKHAKKEERDRTKGMRGA
ncbi:unnamed protein product, partial [Porites evermanni]